jgi:hypothetical protein
MPGSPDRHWQVSKAVSSLRRRSARLASFQFCLSQSVALQRFSLTGMSNTQETTVQQQECPSLEKTAEVSQTHEDSNDSASERPGDFRVVADAGSKDVKLASDGKTVLIPQPSDDPNDVLNWSAGKKYRVLLSLVVASLVWRKLL